jgi:Arc/MetJ-type ribon-helix-helix transcriptional regulator
MTTTVQPQNAMLEAEVPQRLLGEMQALVAAGWFRSLDEIVVDALRRFVESHRGELMDELIREDVDWGLRGSD